MSVHNDNKKQFNLPAYIQTPFFLYQDSRLEKPATLIASFFYSLHTSGLEITASTDYLCELAGIHKRQFYKVMNLLEDCQYISRSGFTNRKKIKWSYSPKSHITVTESDTSALQCTKLVHSSALNYCTPVHTYNKEDTKEYKKLTTVNPTPSSSSFFSEKQKEDLLSYKAKKDTRPHELFLAHCQHHIEHQDNDYGKFERLSGLKHILVKLMETKDSFRAKGFDKIINSPEKRKEPPTKEDFDNYKRCIPGFEWVRDWRKQG